MSHSFGARTFSSRLGNHLPLLRSPPAWDVAGRRVFVCENPNLVAIAADRWGPGCAPLVCTDGMPAAAQRTLLQQLLRSGASLRCHADFDWAGLRIANQLLRHAGAAPWRMGVADYEAAARAANAASATSATSAASTGEGASLQQPQSQRSSSLSSERRVASAAAASPAVVDLLVVYTPAAGTTPRSSRPFR